jgi:hypothetical protein
MSHDLTRWIEDAEARRFRQAAAFDQSWVAPTRRQDLLGETIARVPAWFHTLTHVGHARSYNKR